LRKFVLWVAVIVLLSSAYQAHAQTSGRMLVQICQGKLPASKSDYEFWPPESFMEVCSAYIRGVADFHDTIWVKLGGKPIFCPPTYQDQDVMRRNLLNYLRKNPAELDWPGVDLVMKSLRSFYPCKGELDNYPEQQLPSEKR